jgi:hypothetical protein
MDKILVKGGNMKLLSKNAKNADTFPNYWNFVTFEVFSAVAMKNAVLWDIKTQLVPHRRHISPLQIPAG